MKGFCVLQPRIPPERFDSFPPDWGMPRRSRCVHISLYTQHSRETKLLGANRNRGNIQIPWSADHEQDWEPYPVDPNCAICDGHAYIHVHAPREPHSVALTTIICIFVIFCFRFFGDVAFSEQFCGILQFLFYFVSVFLLSPLKPRPFVQSFFDVHASRQPHTISSRSRRVLIFL